MRIAADFILAGKRRAFDRDGFLIEITSLVVQRGQLFDGQANLRYIPSKPIRAGFRSSEIGPAGWLND
jgi:hypothetical protein